MAHKLTLHPISFTTAFLTAALSIVVQDKFNSDALKGISAVAFIFGVYSLHREDRLKKGIQKSYRSLSEYCHSLTNSISSFWAKPVTALNVEQTANITGLEQPQQSNCGRSR